MFHEKNGWLFGVFLHRPIRLFSNGSASGLGQLPRPQPLVAGTPHIVSFEALHPRHSLFAAAASLDHALQRLQGVVPVCLDAAVADG